MKKYIFPIIAIITIIIVAVLFWLRRPESVSLPVDSSETEDLTPVLEVPNYGNDQGMPDDGVLR